MLFALLSTSMLGISAASDAVNPTVSDSTNQNLRDQVLPLLQNAKTLNDAIIIIGENYTQPNHNIKDFIHNDASFYIEEFKRLIDSDTRDDDAVILDVISLIDARHMTNMESNLYYMQNFMLPLVHDRFIRQLKKETDFENAVSHISGIFRGADNSYVNTFLDIYGLECVAILRKLYQVNQINAEAFDSTALLALLISSREQDFLSKLNEKTKARLMEFINAILDQNQPYYSVPTIEKINNATKHLLEEGKIKEYLSVINKNLSAMAIVQSPQETFEYIYSSLKYFQIINAKIELDDAKLSYKICKKLFDEKNITADQYKELLHLVFTNFYMKIEGLALQMKIKESLNVLFSLGDDGKEILSNILQHNDLIENPEKKTR